MKKMTFEEMEKIEGGATNWTCVAIAAIAITSGLVNPISALFFIGAGVAAGCFGD
ncbi:hypothetical protein KA005_51195 [bacterium]|nr:hypothetical protein [bacterium]